MATVVDLSKHNSYHIIFATISMAFVRCVVHVWFTTFSYLMVECVLVMSLFIYLHHVCLTVNKTSLMINLFMWWVSSVSQMFNHTSVHDKAKFNKEDVLHIINFYSLKTYICMHV